jgi:enterochelin esterase-like enzyme
MNRNMRAILEKKGAVIQYGEHDGKHVWGFWQQYIPEGLQAFLRAEG